jgi:tetratricopeptide (TPR) repeat protein
MGPIFDRGGRTRPCRFRANCGAATRCTGQSSDTLNDLGTALYNGKNYPAAEALFRKAIAADPDQALGYCNLGAVLTSQGKYDEAIAALHRAIDLDPSLELAQNNLAWAIGERNKLK